MKFRTRSIGGFTLIELMVAVSLMIILVMALFIVFDRATEVFSSSEAKMDVFQNARVALDQISKELSSIQTDVTGAQFLKTANPNRGNPVDMTVLSFTTITSWVSNAGVLQEGRAFVEYKIQRIDNERLNLIRKVSKEDGTNPGEGILCQFLHSDANNLPIEVGFFTFSGGAWTYSNVNKNFDSNTPSALRLTMDLRDRQKRVVRTLSRIMFVANGN